MPIFATTQQSSEILGISSGSKGPVLQEAAVRPFANILLFMLSLPLLHLLSSSLLLLVDAMIGVCTGLLLSFLLSLRRRLEF